MPKMLIKEQCFTRSDDGPVFLEANTVVNVGADEDALELAKLGRAAYADRDADKTRGKIYSATADEIAGAQAMARERKAAEKAAAAGAGAPQ